MNITGYRIEEQIGAGGMAMVYRAVQESLGRPVALKVMNPLFSDSAEFSERFLDEGRLLASVHHTNIITIHDIGISDGVHFISMEYVEGGDLTRKIRQGVSPEQATRYVMAIADCLSAAHDAHIVHRDIKPANILFRKDGTLLLTDFGIAKQLTMEKALTVTGSMVGSPNYLSPEQAKGQAVDGRADIYSLGVMYYEMLVGEKPFKGSSEVDIALKHVTEPMPELPESLSAYRGIVGRMTRKKPDERFPSCKSLVIALRELDSTGSWSGEVEPIPLAPPPKAGAGGEGAEPRQASGAGTGNTGPADAGATRTLAAAIPRPGSADATVAAGATAVMGSETVAASARAARVARTPEDEIPTRIEAPVPAAAPGRARKSRTWLFVAGGAVALIVGFAAITVMRGQDLATVATEAMAAIERTIAPSTSGPGASPPRDPAVDSQAEEARARREEAERARREAEARERRLAAERDAAERQLREAERRAAEQERLAREAQIARLASQAEAAIDDYRLTTPEATSAYAYYQQILAIDPQSELARDGIDRIADTYYRLAQGAERSWDYDKAVTFAHTGLSLRPEHEELRELRRRLQVEKRSAGGTIKNSLKDIRGLFD